MQKEKIKSIYYIEYFIFVFFINLIKYSPEFMLNIYGKVVKFLFRKLSKKYSKIVDNNLKIAFPNKSEKSLKKLKNRIYNHFAYILIHNLKLYTKDFRKCIKNRLKIINKENFDRAISKNKGLILVSAHFGNWELIPYIFNYILDIKIYGVAKRMKNPLIEKKIQKFRDVMGSIIIDKQGSIKKILKLFKENKIVFILMDQNTIEREGVYVNFFNKTASTVTSVSQLYLKKDIPVLPLFLHYEKDYIVLEFKDEIDFKKTNDNKKDVINLTQLLNHKIEEEIKKYPEQWFWFHNRWKTQPQEIKNEK